jgi:tRNA (guanine-N7-)-methyltransferase
MSRSRPEIDLSGHLIDSGRLFSTEPKVIEWSSVFGDGKAVELEIGSGKGLFLLNAARSEPGVCYLGIELSRKYARLAAERLAKAELANAKVWCGDARIVLDRVVPAQSLRGVHVYFPDPWWKTRHKKRRVFTGDLVRAIERALAAGGHLSVASDVAEYFGAIRRLIGAGGRFQEVEIAARGDPAYPLDYLTHFERKYRLEGRQIYQARYVILERGESAGLAEPHPGGAG